MPMSNGSRLFVSVAPPLLIGGASSGVAFAGAGAGVAVAVGFVLTTGGVAITGVGPGAGATGGATSGVVGAGAGTGAAGGGVGWGGV